LASLMSEQQQTAAWFHQVSGTLAQLVEQRTFNPLVAGSNPARPTTRLNCAYLDLSPLNRLLA
jgi:hypothetical protein